MADRPRPAITGPSAAIDFTDLVRRWLLPPEVWEQVGELLYVITPAQAESDVRSAERATLDLTHLGVSEARRFGSPPEPGRRPLPHPVRERLNTLVHELESRLPSVPDPESGESDSNAEATETTEATETAATVATGLSRLVATVSAAARRTLVPLPRFDRSSVAFAASGDAPPHRVITTWSGHGLRVVRSSDSPGSVDIVVTVTGGSDRDSDEAGSEASGEGLVVTAPGDVVTLTARSDGRGDLTLLLPLWVGIDGAVMSTVTVATRAAIVEHAVSQPFPGRWLTATDVEAVARSVPMTSRSGRNAWRAVARARPAGDPVRAAVAEGLPST